MKKELMAKGKDVKGGASKERSAMAEKMEKAMVKKGETKKAKK